MAVIGQSKSWGHWKRKTELNLNKIQNISTKTIWLTGAKTCTPDGFVVIESVSRIKSLASSTTYEIKQSN